jgi:GNAT superfamily N-acetyltransferase
VDPAITVVPANEASWDDVQAVFGTRGDSARCQCQRYRTTGMRWQEVPREEYAARLRDQTNAGDPDAAHTTGLVAYLGGEPAGWCAVAPRRDYERLRTMPVPWQGRAGEDKDDPGVWAVTCLLTRAGYRRRGVSGALAAASTGFARDRGARALEAYPIIPKPGQDITWGEEHVGLHSVFVAAGFRQVSHPTLRRAVMRVDF